MEKNGFFGGDSSSASVIAFDIYRWCDNNRIIVTSVRRKVFRKRLTRSQSGTQAEWNVNCNWVRDGVRAAEIGL